MHLWLFTLLFCLHEFIVKLLSYQRLVERNQGHCLCVNWLICSVVAGQFGHDQPWFLIHLILLVGTSHHCCAKLKVLQNFVSIFSTHSGKAHILQRSGKCNPRELLLTAILFSVFKSLSDTSQNPLRSTCSTLTQVRGS